MSTKPTIGDATQDELKHELAERLRAQPRVAVVKPTIGDELNRYMSERDLQRIVVDAARLHGWRHYHTYNSQRSTAGFPDLVLVRPPRIMFVELKTERGRLTLEQAIWIRELERCSVEVYVWQPHNIGEMLKTLGRDDEQLRHNRPSTHH